MTQRSDGFEPETIEIIGIVGGLERMLVGQVTIQRRRVLEPRTGSAADVAKLVPVARQDVESNWGRRTHQEANLDKEPVCLLFDAIVNWLSCITGLY